MFNDSLDIYNLVNQNANLHIIGSVFSLLLGGQVLKNLEPTSLKFQTNFSSFDFVSNPVLVITNDKMLEYANAAGFDFLNTKFPNVSIDCLPEKIEQFLGIWSESKLDGTFIHSFKNGGGCEKFMVNANVYNDHTYIIQIIKMPDETLIQASEIHEQKLLQSSLDELSYIISHDLVEPVRTIKSFSQIIQKTHLSLLTNQEAYEDFQFLIDASNRLHNMIQGMLQYSRLSSKKFYHEETDTLEVLVEVIKDLMAATNESNASIQCYDMPRVKFNKTLLVQVFSNLIGNSLKYKSESRPPKIEIYTEDLGHEFLFTVKDNGIGIDNEQADRLFKIFQRLHPNDSKYKGTGMGLAICKKILEKQNGRIWFEGVPNVGTKFFFTVPKA